MISTRLRLMGLGAALTLGGPAPLLAAEIEEIVVWGATQDARSGSVGSLTPADLTSTSVVTAEDLVKFEPGLVIRRRFIGDANGTLGIRGANMFQTSRSMVFADGMPLHYLLQSRWDGAPRWSLISASEIAKVEMLYGPFSAEYGGNSMGGVVLMESRIPQQREFHVDSMAFIQDYSAYGFSEALTGHKNFISYGDRVGALSLYVSYNHLQNASQPQSFHMGAAASSADPVAVSGGIVGTNDIGNTGIYFGDSGVIANTTDNFKLKLGYDFARWSALLNIAFEDRATDANSPRTYLRNAAGAAVWEGSVIQAGQRFSVPAARSGISNSQRNSLSSSLRVKGWLNDNVSVESNLNWFGILRDETRTSASNPAAAAHTPAGQVTAYGGTGWRTADLKLAIDLPAVGGLSLSTGLRHEQYRLNIDVFESDDYRRGSKTRTSARSGGETAIDAAFVQLQWNLGHALDLGLGARYEAWQSRGGFHGSADSGPLERVLLPTRSSAKVSPKFTLGWIPADAWSLRYSAAQAYRFPIVEELFSQYQAFNAVNTANPGLAPEHGMHHNLALEHTLDNGLLALNFYQETVQDVIEAQALLLPGGVSLRTFLPVSEVSTRGIEFVANIDNLLIPGLDLRFNVAWTRALIVSNATDPTLVGKQFPRMPPWRANLLLNYQLTPVVDVGIGLRHAAKSFGRLDNSDTEAGVFGAQDKYLFVNMKANWRLNPHLQLGLGIDNLLDERAYVTHPWPARTLFLEGSYSL